MLNPNVLLLDDFMCLDEPLGEPPVLSMTVDHVRNLLAGSRLTAGPPTHRAAGLMVTPVPGRPDCFFGVPICFGGGSLRMIRHGWELANGDTDDCGLGFKFRHDRELGEIVCWPDCQTGPCESRVFPANGWGVSCSCTFNGDLLGTVGPLVGKVGPLK